jgi:hypothetical protein
LRGKRQPKNLGYLGNLKKLPKENDRPMCENSPNLVTLVATTLSDLEHLNCNAANVSALMYLRAVFKRKAKWQL